MEKTPNFFIERWSNKEKQTEGGPWQAKHHGCDYFVYFFIADETFFVFEVEKLILALEAGDFRTRDIKNTNHTTVGWLVPREYLREIGKQYQLGDPVDW